MIFEVYIKRAALPLGIFISNINGEGMHQGNESLTPLLSGQDMLSAIDCSEFTGNRNGFDALTDEIEIKGEVFLPKMGLQTMGGFMPLGPSVKSKTNSNKIYTK